MDDNPYKAPQSAPRSVLRSHLAIKRATWLIVILEAGAAIALIRAALLGDSTIRFDGLHVARLAYDDIGFTILAVYFLSCVLAAVLFARIAKSWNRVEVLTFVAALIIGWLAASAYGNGRVTFNGASTQWISWSANLWVLAALIAFVLRASRLDSRRSGSA